MAFLRNCLPAFPRLAAAMTLLLALAALPSLLLSPTASAGDKDAEAGVRFYFALPFIASGDPQPARLGFQLLSELDDGTAYAPLNTDSDMATALDLGFTREGLAKFDVIGADARGAYDAFARAIGLTPDEVELCRENDCLDWVKGGRKAALREAPLGQD